MVPRRRTPGRELSGVEHTLLEIDDRVALAREFGYSLFRCPKTAGGACLRDARYGKPCAKPTSATCTRLGGTGMTYGNSSDNTGDK